MSEDLECLDFPDWLMARRWTLVGIREEAANKLTAECLSTLSVLVKARSRAGRLSYGEKKTRRGQECSTGKRKEVLAHVGRLRDQHESTIDINARDRRGPICCISIST